MNSDIKELIVAVGIIYFMVAMIYLDCLWRRWYKWFSGREGKYRFFFSVVILATSLLASITWPLSMYLENKRNNSP